MIASQRRQAWRTRSKLRSSTSSPVSGSWIRRGHARQHLRAARDRFARRRRSSVHLRRYLRHRRTGSDGAEHAQRPRRRERPSERGRGSGRSALTRDPSRGDGPGRRVGPGHRRAGILGADDGRQERRRTDHHPIPPDILRRRRRKSLRSTPRPTSRTANAIFSTASRSSRSSPRARPAVTPGLEIAESERDRVGVAIGSGMGGITTQDEAYKRLYAQGITRAHPFTIPRIMNNAAAAHVSMQHGLRGPALSIATACAAAAHAIGEAAEMIRAGRADAMLAGGADAPIAPGVVRSWEAMRVLAPRRGRSVADVPAVQPRSIGHGARRRRRDRRPRIVGTGGVARGRHSRGAHRLRGHRRRRTHDATRTTRTGARDRPRARAEPLAPADIDYVNAHGTATRLNDATETAIIKRVFGDHAARLAVSSTKALHGHAMGASAALEFIATVLAVRNSIVPPTANYTERDPECDLDYVPNEARPEGPRGDFELVRVRRAQCRPGDPRVDSAAAPASPRRAADTDRR